MGVAGVIFAAAGGGCGAPPCLGFHSPEHPARLWAPSSGRGPAGLIAAEVIAGGAGVISAACGIFWTPSLVIRCALHEPIAVPHVGGEAGQRRLQRLIPVLSPWTRIR